MINFYRALVSEEYMMYLPVQLYVLFGGGVFTIEARTFKERLTDLIEQLSKALSTSHSITTRNIETLRLSNARRGVLDESVRMVMLAKNKPTLTEIVNKITQSIFHGSDYLKQ